MTDHDEPAKEQTTEKSAAQPAEVSSFWERIRHLIASGFGSPNWLGSVRLWIGVLGAVFGAIVLLWLFDKVVFYYLARNYVDEVAKALDLDPHLANALILLTFVVAIFFARFLWSFSRQRRIVGISGLAGLLIAHSLVLWWATRDIIMYKCYVISRDGNVTYREHTGIDPATGRECRPVKPEMVERLRDYQAGRRPQRLTAENPVFFDSRSSEPIIWYYRSKNNEIQLFDLMGFHPDTGDELIPISKEIVEEWKLQNIPPPPPPPPPRVPNRIDPNTFVFFDRLSGEPLAWYWKTSDGEYEFYDGPGFHPQTGDALKIATRDMVEEAHHGTPRRIDPKTYPPFDPRTGRAQVWYWRSRDGRYEFYDAPGFHPQSGEKLALVTRDVIEDWNNGVRPPQGVTPPPPGLQPQNIGAQLHQRTAEFLDTLYRTVSNPNGDLLAFWNNIYADQVNFFGQSYSRGQVIGESQRNVARWPIEQYSIKPGSLQIDCDEQWLSCRASGFVDFDARSPARNQRSWGTASFEYVLKFASVTAAPKITQESGEVKTRNLGPSSDIVPPPSGSQTWNGCPPNWTIQGGVCKPYQGPTANPRPPDEAIIRGIIGGVLQRMGH